MATVCTAVYEKRAKELSDTYYSVLAEWNDPWSIIYVIHIS